VIGALGPTCCISGPECRSHSERNRLCATLWLCTIRFHIIEQCVLSARRPVESHRGNPFSGETDQSLCSYEAGGGAAGAIIGIAGGDSAASGGLRSRRHCLVSTDSSSGAA